MVPAEFTLADQNYPLGKIKPIERPASEWCLKVCLCAGPDRIICYVQHSLKVPHVGSFNTCLSVFTIKMLCVILEKIKH